MTGTAVQFFKKLLSTSRKWVGKGLVHFQLSCSARQHAPGFFQVDVPTQCFAQYVRGMAAQHASGFEIGVQRVAVIRVYAVVDDDPRTSPVDSGAPRGSVFQYSSGEHAQAVEHGCGDSARISGLLSSAADHRRSGGLCRRADSQSAEYSSRHAAALGRAPHWRR